MIVISNKYKIDIPSEWIKIDYQNLYIDFSIDRSWMDHMSQCNDCSLFFDFLCCKSIDDIFIFDGNKWFKIENLTTLFNSADNSDYYADFYLTFYGGDDFKFENLKIELSSNPLPEIRRKLISDIIN